MGQLAAKGPAEHAIICRVVDEDPFLTGRDVEHEDVSVFGIVLPGMVGHVPSVRARREASERDRSVLRPLVRVEHLLASQRNRDVVIAVALGIAVAPVSSSSTGPSSGTRLDRSSSGGRVSSATAGARANAKKRVETLLELE